MRMLSLEECNITAAGLYYHTYYDLDEQYLLAHLTQEQRDRFLKVKLLTSGTLLGGTLGAGSTYALISCLTACPFLLGTGMVIGAAGGAYTLYSGLNYLVADLSIS